MTTRLRLDEEGAPVVVVDVDGTPRQLTAWGVVDAGDAVALLLSTGRPLTAAQAAAIAGQLDPETIERLRLARDGRLVAIEHATAWEAEARAARRPTLPQPAAPVIDSYAGTIAVDFEPQTQEIPRVSGAHAWRPDDATDDADEGRGWRWYDYLAVVILALLGIAGILAGLHWDDEIIGIFGGACAGAAIGVTVAGGGT